jgi:hypothetical protein
MVLLWAVAAGLATGLGRAGSQKVRYEAPVLKHLWLAFIAFLPQSLVVYLPVREVLSEESIAFCLILSQLLLFVFAFLNRDHVGMKILMIGTVLNGLVMIVNGGFMPISPQIAGRLVPQDILSTIALGSRFGSKDILLLPEHTHLEWLADRFLSPAWLPYQVAFSLGDIFIAVGVFWLLARQKNIQQGYYP